MRPLFKGNEAPEREQHVLHREIDERGNLSAQIFERRRLNGWSQDELAQRSGMKQPQIALLEAGQANPTLKSLVRIAHALSCTVADLLVPDCDPSVATLREWALGGAETLSFEEPEAEQRSLFGPVDGRTREASWPAYSGSEVQLDEIMEQERGAPGCR